MEKQSVVLFCKHCNVGYASLGEIPIICPACEQATKWTTKATHPDVPKFPYDLNHNDRRFLRALKIAP